MNVFTKLKDKIKDFFTETTSASKLKYAVVSVILLVAVAAVAVVGTAGSEEAPEATLSTESLTIQFDEEIVFNFDEETDEDEPSSVEENADVTETDPAEESTEPESEENTKSESTEAETSESTTDKQSAPSEETDPETDAAEDTIVPVTEAPVTEPAVTQKPAAQKPVTEAPVTEPAVTQKPAAQKPAAQKPVTEAPVTEPAVTQKPATQKPVTEAPVTEPAVTQKPATQKPVTEAPVTEPAVTQKPVTQKPSVDEPEESKNYGNWVVKQKKYYYDTAPYVIYFKGMDDIYNGPTTPGNVMILNIENKSDEAYTITISAKYLDSAGNVIGTEDRTFEGFAANWSNYFVFAPGYEFDKFTFDFSAKKYNAETYVQYFKIYEECSVSTPMALDGGNGRESYSVGEEGFDAMKKLIAVYAGVRCGYTGTGIVEYTGTLVIFDKNGDLAYIREATKGNVTGSPEVGKGEYFSRALFLTDIPYSEVGSYKIPDNLTSVTGFYAIESFSRK